MKSSKAPARKPKSDDLERRLRGLVRIFNYGPYIDVCLGVDSINLIQGHTNKEREQFAHEFRDRIVNAIRTHLEANP